MTGDSEIPPDASAQTVDLTASLGSFLILSKQGRLFALNRIEVSRDFARFDQDVYSSPAFSALYPLVAAVRPSKLTLAIDPPQVHYLVNLHRDPGSEGQRVFASTPDVIAECLDEERFPILTLVELERAVAISRNGGTPLRVAVRFLEPKPSLPDRWRAGLRSLFETNTRPGPDKATRISECLTALGTEIRRTLFSAYLTKCMWLDQRTHQLGKLVEAGEGVEFAPFTLLDHRIQSFHDALVRHDDGSYDCNTDVGWVLPGLVKGSPWACPTLHVHNEKFRDRNKLDEYHSLYQGMRALSRIGAPVLLYAGQNPLEAPTGVGMLRVAWQAPGPFQTEAREFPARELVWSSESQPADWIDLPSL